MKSTKTCIRPDRSTLTVVIAHSQIVVMLPAAQRFPPDFDDRDVPSLNGLKPKVATPNDPIFANS
jgi:hypothetical protein